MDHCFITIERLKDLYKEYRAKYELGGPVRFGEAVLRPAFNENNIYWKIESRLVIDGKPKTNIAVASGLMEVRLEERE